MSVFPVVKGIRLRATKINRCGLPISGAANRIITDGFVSVALNPVMKDAEELEQTNAEGKVCVADRTPPIRKYHTVELTLCNVNTGLISLFSGWNQVLDYANNSIGFQDNDEVDGDYGVALEVWTGGRSDSDCPPQTVDSIFSSPTSGKSYGYLLFGATEFTLGNIEVTSGISTFTLSGVTVAMPQWGKGPYNVAALDSSGTPGRLLTPLGSESHFTMFRTPVEPPEVTDGGNPVALDIPGKFTGTTYYFGGPSNAPAASVAPDQDSSSTKTLSISGSPTGGTFTLSLNGNVTGNIAYNASAAAVKSALVAVDDGYTTADFTTTGGALPGTDVVITYPSGVLEVGANALTGGTDPTVTLS